MKKALFTGILAAIVGLVGGTSPGYAADDKSANAGSTQELAPSARSAILLDADTGTIIYEKNSHDKLPPASITKIMTMLLTMEAIEDGRLKWTDKVRTSEYAASMGGSQIFLEPGEEMTVEEMLKGIAMASGNDASVAMAEKIAGSEEAFVQMMNDKAAELGMKNTHFVNCNGLPAADHYTTAHDIALMSRELLKYEEITKYTGAYQDYLRQDTPKPFWLVNTNKLVRFYSGADGLKTGYTSEAKFCLSATAKRDGLRAVAVVMGAPDTKTRNSDISRMFDYAFSQYSMHSIFKTGEVLGTVKIQKGKVPELALQAEKDYSVLVKKGGKTTELRHEIHFVEDLKAPVDKGQIIGKLSVYQGEQLVKEFELASPVSVKKAGFWNLFKRTTSKLFDVD
ncbi:MULTISPECIES: D-alanyl-D-alanine carboxypeptidase family protein [Paenibacillus]|uniref:serine-type D-Ala-D-Ala carboxypeptidase n=1 Tax=Paenibacillus campinasensis TaxID=66347 RepID=A0A268F2Q9_9BACL|nr:MULTISPECIES: D-alanyl-D-alanine carboxypeptidase family protein [Paenibacillus]PAD79660.1 D-alanyl-D-alanine carboxypeptidase [Paenibacillus campinasensis]PAK53523.1 D-alanyl-D-alanine carboxypeptidase [Paenibacillus sp. 7541]